MTAYITLGLNIPTGGVVNPLVRKEVRAIIKDRAQLYGWTVHTYARGEGFYQGEVEPCYIWALSGLYRTEAHVLAQDLAILCEQECVCVTFGSPVFVTQDGSY